MSVRQIREELLTRWRDDAILELCLRILDNIAALPADQRRILTFRTICRAANKRGVDGDVLSALNVLVNSSVAALDVHAFLVDDDETEHELDAQTLAEARTTGKLVHPETGELVPEFEKRVVPFFVPSERFEQ